MSGNRRKALLLSAALVSGALMMTACQNSDTGAAQDPAAVPVGNASTPNDGGQDKDQAGDQGSGVTGDGSDDAPGSGADLGDGERVPVEEAQEAEEAGGTGDAEYADGGDGVGQVCGANDISWSTRSESQAGGYILVIAQAKDGISCYLPAGLPTVAFGSDGTQAGPAEQAAGPQIELSGDTTAYAGVNPKTTNTDTGKELDFIIVGVGDDDPNPVSLPVGTITVEDPIVTNWHTDPADAVPFG
ncbi:DUF4232 domain-containing protein [Streptomyces sp. NPDC059477]|uniref:DUF4232 domain-containing protein n=1 Tax=Streptomyces sp. NPDC059477 TaxID=3346847 RepID=UPI0036C71041